MFTQMTAEAILRLVNDPVLPFYPLDIALDVQNKLKGNTDDDIMAVIMVMMVLQRAGGVGAVSSGCSRWVGM